MPAELNPTTIRTAPKVLLHDHLDGGLRPQTHHRTGRGHRLRPAAQPPTPSSCANWFVESANSGSLVRYLETFDHTVAVMQTREGLHRVASECAQDLADDGVVYAEVRWAPEQHVSDGLSLAEVVEATLEGFAHGSQAAAERGKQIRIGALATAMRHAARSREIAELAVAYRDRGVVGFDIAGAEAGFPPTRHLDAFEYLRRENFHFTIHAGEAFGLPSIWEAIQWCGTDRLGPRRADHRRHQRSPAPAWRSRWPPRNSAGWPSTSGTSGSRWRCARPRTSRPARPPRSPSHPIGLLRRLHFRVTVNTDNRLMSEHPMTREMALLAEAFDYSWSDLQWLTVNAMKSAFIPFDDRLAIINSQIKPGYAALSV